MCVQQNTRLPLPDQLTIQTEPFFLVRTPELVLNRGQYFFGSHRQYMCSEEHAGFDLSPHAKKVLWPTCRNS